MEKDQHAGIGMDVHSSMSTAYVVATDPMDAAERDMAEDLNRSFKKFLSDCPE